MKRSLLSIALSLAGLAAMAQSVAWTAQGKSPQNTYGNGITCDNNGNVYITGTFRDSLRFGNILLTESNFGTAYCAKYDTSGNVVWAKKDLGGEGLAFDGTANIYLFDDDNQNVQKIDLAGNLVWNKSLFTTSQFGSNGILDLVTKGSDFYITGYYSGDGYFGSDTLVNEGGWDIFIAMYDNAGQVQWANTAGGAGLDKGYGLYVNASDEVYATGYFADTAYFDQMELYSAGNKDMYICKLDQNADFAWVKSYGSPTGLDLCAAIVADENENLYATGRFHNSITMGNVTLNGNQSDAFVCRFDKQGNVVWAKNISGQGNDEEAGICYANGKVKFIATTAGNVTLDNASLNGIGNLDICLGIMDTLGNVSWLKNYGGTADDEGGGIVQIGQSLYFTGSFNGTASFDNFQLTSQQSWDIVTAKIGLQPSAIVSVKAPEEMVFYPNPFTDRIQLISGERLLAAALFDLTGKAIAVELENNVVKIKDALPAGMYLLRVQDASGVRNLKVTRQ